MHNDTTVVDDISLVENDSGEIVIETPKRRGRPRKLTGSDGGSKPRHTTRRKSRDVMANLSRHVSRLCGAVLVNLSAQAFGNELALLTSEAESLIEPAARIVTRHLPAFSIRGTRLSDDDANDVGEIAVTAIEYGARCVAILVLRNEVRKAAAQLSQQNGKNVSDNYAFIVRNMQANMSHTSGVPTASDIRDKDDASVEDDIESPSPRPHDDMNANPIYIPPDNGAYLTYENQ